MHVRFEPGGVVGAAVHLTAAADAARRLADAAAGLGSGVLDRGLVEALGVLGDVCGDALEVVGLDLELLATSVTSGATLYSGVEDTVVRAARPGTAPR